MFVILMVSHLTLVSGACGEIYAQLKSGKKLINPLVAAQNFEYSK